MTATATWDPVGATWTLTTTLPGTATWHRTTLGAAGEYTYRRIGTGSTLIDPAAPVDGSQISWTAANGYDDQTVTVHPDPGPGPVLSVPAMPALPAATVTVLTLRAYEVTGRPYFYDVLGRSTAWLEPQPPIERTGELVLDLPHTGAAFPGDTLRQVRDILRTGQPVLLRSTCQQRVETVGFAVLSFTETHPGQGNSHGPDRRITIRWRAVEPLWGDEGATVARLWMEVPQEFPTWDDVKASGLTWDELAYG